MSIQMGGQIDNLHDQSLKYLMIKNLNHHY